MMPGKITKYHWIKQGCVLLNTFWNFLLDASEAFFGRRSIPAYTNRRQTVQPIFIKSKDKHKKQYHKRHTVCRRCSGSRIQPKTHSIFDGLTGLPMHAKISVPLSASKYTTFLAQGTTSPHIYINDYQLEVEDEFT